MQDTQNPSVGESPLYTYSSAGVDYPEHSQTRRHAVAVVPPAEFMASTKHSPECRQSTLESKFELMQGIIGSTQWLA
jgi:hypothetical protein